MKHFFLQSGFSCLWFVAGLILGGVIATLLLVIVGKKAAKEATDRINRNMEVNHEISKILNQ